MLLKIVYLLTRRMLSLAVLAFRGDLAKDAELLVFRGMRTRYCGGMRAGCGMSRASGPGSPR